MQAIRAARSRLHTLATKPVEQVAASSLSPSGFLADYVRSAHRRPVHFTSPAASSSRSTELLRVLREQAGETMVDAELSASATDGHKTMTLPLSLYLDWLTADAETLGRIGTPPYLAQSRLTELLPALAQAMPAPTYLAPSIDTSLDLYQLAHFLGPQGSQTPVHCDPFDVFATSDARDRKHVVLWPPDAKHWLQDGDDAPIQPNLGATRVEMELDGTVRSELKPGTPQALSCSLAEDEALWIPKGWWHAIRNGNEDGTSRMSFSAAIGAWFLPRS